MASIDLQDAYYSVPIAIAYHKYLKFSGEENFRNMFAFQMDWHFVPCRKFTKLLKSLYIHI